MKQEILTQFKARQKSQTRYYNNGAESWLTRAKVYSDLQTNAFPAILIWL